MIFRIGNDFKYYSGVYAIENLIDDRFYIGSTKCLFERFKDHLYYFKKQKHANKYMQAFVNKYGLETLSFELLFLCKNTCLTYNEKLWIDTLKPQFNIRKIIQRPYFDDVERFTLKEMRRQFDEVDIKLKNQLEEHYKKYPRIIELNYKEEKDFYFGIPPSCPFPREVETKKLNHWDKIIKEIRSENKNQKKQNGQ